MPVIEQVTIRSFRCITELTLDLAPLTVLVGPNASGKSTVLEALAQPPSSLVDWADASGPCNAKRRPVARLLQLELTEMRRATSVKEQKHLSRGGANISQVIHSFPRRVQEDLAQHYCNLVDVFADVDVRPQAGQGIGVVFQDRWDENSWFTANQVSDGSLLALAFLVLQRETPRSPLICIEEPERGLHPYLLGKIIALLRDIAEGKHGEPTQFILATQSAELLDHVRPEEVRFLERDADGGVRATAAPTKDEAWQDAIKEYEDSMGRMWLSGGLGGVPAL